ncbi:MAG: ATP-dependent protease ATPase subunit HslU [Candidatus Hydrogenedentota bacterium]
METLTPKEIVAELDKYIVGQHEAKRKVAIALRNRWRRQQLSAELREDVTPKNIIMIGPTGVGKTEIARRLSKLVKAPFVKVEASKFTEVGYVGRDCESMVRDLMETAINLVRDEMKKACQVQARANARVRILDALLPPKPRGPERVFNPMDPRSGDEGPALSIVEPTPEERTREMIAAKLDAGELDDREIDITVRDNGQMSTMQMFSNSGLEEMGMNFQEMMGRMMPQKTKSKKVRVEDAFDLLEQEELDSLLDMDKVTEEAVYRTENSGIIFLDEIDKIAGKGGTGSGPDISREGVQRDILPIVEGSTVTTKYGPIRTDHILFIAAGAFHIAKVSDLIPELQGRFPIRVELHSLGSEDFARILREPKNSLIRQYEGMLKTEDVNLIIQDDAIEEMAKVCTAINDETENIGARRLHTIMEYLLEEISYDAPENPGETVTIDAKFVRERLTDLIETRDLDRFVL